jgi:molecular chaperone HtpG
MSVNNTNTETLHFQTEVKQLLHLVTHSLYSNKEIFLRELISNAADAADKLRFSALANDALYEGQEDLKIWITFDKAARTISIKDNGIGMSREEVIANLGTIAKSGTSEFLSQLTGDQQKDARLIGQFGVGFYSAFVVADKVTVHTRLAGCTADLGVYWESTGTGEYTIANENIANRGTEVVLHLKESAEEFLDDWRLRSIITKYSDHLNMPILMLKLPDADEKTDNNSSNVDTEPTWQQINRATALWVMAKNDISDTQYCEFYKHLAHDFQDPLVWSHNRVEGGNLDYISLLYIPQHAPMELLQRDKHYGLKLYVQRVFIMDQVEQFLPAYLRFVRGVVDTNDLPLNVSRELLQEHAIITKLRAALVKRTLDMLNDLAHNDADKYLKFWQQFGNFLKEGPGEDFNNRELIASLLRFASSSVNSSEQTTALADYVKRMPSQQKKIYYIVADSFSAGKASPHMEIFAKNNIEVLILHDRIDEWFVAHFTVYQDKPLQSITKGELALEEITTTSNEELKAEAEKNKDEFAGLIQRLQSVLADEVKEIRISQRLIASPACLVREQHEMSPQLQRLLQSVGQEVTAVKPILEINPVHKLIEQLNSVNDTTELHDWAKLIYDQAVLAEGGQLKDPAAFVNRMNNLWLNML